VASDVLKPSVVDLGFLNSLLVVSPFVGDASKYARGQHLNRTSIQPCVQNFVFAPSPTTEYIAVAKRDSHLTL
jgi:hypothetical protein